MRSGCCSGQLCTLARSRLAAIAGGFWPGLIVFIVLTVAVVLWWARARRS